jgi:hypothetical protein
MLLQDDWIDGSVYMRTASILQTLVYGLVCDVMRYDP